MNYTIKFKEDDGSFDHLEAYENLAEAANKYAEEHGEQEEVAVVSAIADNGKRVWAVNTKNHGTNIPFSLCFDDPMDWWVPEKYDQEEAFQNF